MIRPSVLFIALLLCIVGGALATINLNDEGLIRAVNTHPKAAWRARTYEKFNGKTLSEVSHLFGAYLTNGLRPSLFASANNSTARSLSLNRQQQQQQQHLPTHFDSRDKWSKCIAPIRNQEQCGSCWAFSSASMLSDRFCIATNGASTPVLSPQFMVSCDKYDMACNGGNMDSLWKFLSTTGTVEDKCSPYVSGLGYVPSCSNTCVDGSALKLYRAHAGSIRNFHKSDMRSVQEEIMNHGPVMTGFMVMQDFMQYSSGVYHHVTGSLLGGHAIKIVGWGIDSESSLPYWIAANSWGEEWGMKGYFWIRRGNDECQIEQNMYTARADI